MSLDRRKTAGLPRAIRERLPALGARLRQARLARGLTQARLADAAFVERTTVMRLERGDPGVGIGVLGSVLFVLQLEADLDHIADPSRDRVLAAAIERRMPRDAPRRRPTARELDF